MALRSVAIPQAVLAPAGANLDYFQNLVAAEDQSEALDDSGKHAITNFVLTHRAH